MSAAEVCEGSTLQFPISHTQKNKPARCRYAARCKCAEWESAPELVLSAGEGFGGSVESLIISSSTAPSLMLLCLAPEEVRALLIFRIKVRPIVELKFYSKMQEPV